MALQPHHFSRLGDHFLKGNFSGANIDHQVPLSLEFDGLLQVGNYIIYADRFSSGAHPARGEHEGEFMAEISNYFETRTAGTYDHPGPEPDGGNLVRFCRKGFTCLDPAQQVLAGAGPVSQSAEVDYPSDTSGDSGPAKIFCAFQIQFSIVFIGTHRMDKVEGGINTLQTICERVRIEGRPFIDLYRFCGSRLDFAVVSDEQSQSVTVSTKQMMGEPPADVAGCPGNEDYGF